MSQNKFYLPNMEFYKSRDIFSYILKQFAEYIVSLLRFLKGFYCSLPWVWHLVQRCRLQLEVFFTISSPIWNLLSSSHSRGSFCKKYIGMENLSKILLFFVKWNSICPWLKNCTHYFERIIVFLFIYFYVNAKSLLYIYIYIYIYI